MATTTVDSKQDQLTIPEIITQAVYNTPTEGVPAYAAILGIVKEGTMPNTEVKNYGNTVFITHFAKDGQIALGRALNIDSANNFLLNGEAYFRDLVRAGVQTFLAQFDQTSFARAFMMIKRRPVTTEMKLKMGKTPKGYVQIRIDFDGDLIERPEQ
jgi:hypothetical protein